MDPTKRLQLSSFTVIDMGSFFSRKDRSVHWWSMTMVDEEMLKDTDIRIE
jgi:hypothetical protein